jgi:hypothetical protein
MGTEAVATLLINRLWNSSHPAHTRDVKTMKYEHDYLRVEGEDWFLQVRGDGAWVRYRRDSYVDQVGKSAGALSEAPDATMLARTARAFVENELAELVPLCDDEELVHFRTLRTVERAVDVRTREAVPERVVATSIIFSRTIGGIDVLGPGSKVKVIFASDLGIAGFDVDWSEFDDVGLLEETLGIDEVKNDRTWSPTATSTSADVELFRFECGYYDVGSHRADPNALLQPACISHYLLGQKTDGVWSRGGVFHVAPIGRHVEPDGAWPEVQAQLGLPQP